MHSMSTGFDPSLSSMNLFTPAASANATSAATGSSSTGSSSSSSTGTGLDGTTTGTTFLSLLVKELQNQDPSAPMDSTAMVGQMISLNQLDQLVSINGELSPTTTSTTSTAQAASGVTPNATTGSQNSAALVAAKNALLNDSSLSSSVNAASLAASNPNTTLDLSSFTNQFGGK